MCVHGVCVCRCVCVGVCTGLQGQGVAGQAASGGGAGDHAEVVGRSAGQRAELAGRGACRAGVAVAAAHRRGNIGGVEVVGGREDHGHTGGVGLGHVDDLWSTGRWGGRV